MAHLARGVLATISPATRMKSAATALPLRRTLRSLRSRRVAKGVNLPSLTTEMAVWQPNPRTGMPTIVVVVKPSMVTKGKTVITERPATVLKSGAVSVVPRAIKGTRDTDHLHLSSALVVAVVIVAATAVVTTIGADVEIVATVMSLSLRSTSRASRGRLAEKTSRISSRLGVPRFATLS